MKTGVDLPRVRALLEDVHTALTDAGYPSTAARVAELLAETESGTMVPPCRLCARPFDLTTEDPQYPGLCRACGDQRRLILSFPNFEPAQ